jgi:hypothetical protein
VLEVWATSAARTASGDTGARTNYSVVESLRVHWNTIGSFAQKTAAGREVINITEPFADTVRARWTIGGAAPNFAFDLRAYVQ